MTPGRAAPQLTTRSAGGTLGLKEPSKSSEARLSARFPGTVCGPSTTVTSRESPVTPTVCFGRRDLARCTGAEFHATVANDSIELLFLHPLPFDGQFWSPFEVAIQPIATHTPTIYTLGTSLEEVARAVLDLVAGRRLVVVGNSIGGSCALEIAKAAPDRVDHLLLIGTKAGHRPEPDYRDWALNLLASEGVAGVWARVWESLFSPETSPSVVAEARATALSMPPDLLAAGIAMFHGRRDLAHVIDEWRKPLTVLAGDHDHAPTPRVSRAMVRRAPQAVFEVVPGCGHYVPIEQPHTFSRVLDEVIASVA